MEARFLGYRLLTYLPIFPSVAVIAAFLVVPFAQAVDQSLYRTSPSGTTTRFVGWDNYVQVFTTPEYVRSLVVTLGFAGLVMAWGLSVALGVAVLVTRRIRGLAFYQVCSSGPMPSPPRWRGSSGLSSSIRWWGGGRT